ncbi:hypothetical protein HDZ31DRAFT_64013 [Schizophyllum fasciatum]
MALLLFAGDKDGPNSYGSQCRGGGEVLVLDLLLERYDDDLAWELATHRTLFTLYSSNAAAIRDRMRDLLSLVTYFERSSAECHQACLDVVRSRIATNSALLAPWRQLPCDLWSEIFLYAAPDRWDRHFAGTMTPNFAQVCRVWRQVAFNTTGLWVYFNVNAYYHNPSDCREAIIEEMRRSMQAPLQLLNINATRWTCEGRCVLDKDWSEQIWELLCAQSRRWAKLKSDVLVTEQYRALSGRSFPILQSLTFGMLPARPGRDDPQPLDFFSDAPMLSELTIESLAPPNPPRARPVRFSTAWVLQSLDMSCSTECDEATVPLSDCLDAIMTCGPTLRKCTIWCAEVGTLPANHNITDFPRLGELTLQGNAVHLCRFVSAPNVTMIIFEDNFGPETSPAPSSLAEMVDRSAGCVHLEAFTLSNIHSNSHELINCLWRLQNLISLRIWDSAPHADRSYAVSRSKELVNALTRHNSGLGTSEDHVLLPHLERLDMVPLFQSTVDPAFEGAVAAMIKSRQKPLVWRDKTLPGLPRSA